MRHMKTGRKLNRTSSHRKALYRNMSVSLLKHEMIKTTLPKAKELRSFIEPLITKAKKEIALRDQYAPDSNAFKDQSVALRRLVFSRIRNKEAVKKLFETLAPRYEDRPGGYTRVLKCGYRSGDSAPMAYIELVDRPEEIEPQEAEAEQAE